MKNMMTLQSLASAIYQYNHDKYVDISDFDSEDLEGLISLLFGLKIPLNPLANALYILDKENHVDVSGFEHQDELLKVIEQILTGWFKMDYEISGNYLRICD